MNKFLERVQAIRAQQQSDQELSEMDSVVFRISDEAKADFYLPRMKRIAARWEKWRVSRAQLEQET